MLSDIIIPICKKKMFINITFQKGFILQKIVYFSKRIPTNPSDPEEKCTEQYFLKPGRSELSFTAGT